MNIIQIGCNDCNDHVFDFIKENQNIINNFFVVDALPKCCEKAQEVYSFIDNLKIFNKAIGLENTIIVETEDALLVCDKSKAQDVQEIYNKLKDKNDTVFNFTRN